MVDLGGDTVTAGERDLLCQPAVGGVILFSRNYRDKDQLRDLAGEIKSLREPKLLIAVDQEGGAVQRFKKDFYELPAAATIGEIYDRDRDRARTVADAAGCLMAAEVLDVGVDFSFAPVLDCQNPASGVIGARAFHRDPAIVAELAGAFVGGMHRAGMAATGKHFPGHGGVAGDSHEETPVDGRGVGKIKKRDLVPFARLAGKLGGVMTAHVLFSNIDERPPTYSAFWLKKILRDELNFTGVVFSDDLSMKGAGGGDTGANAVAALAAGVDMALVCNNPAAARRAADAVADGHRCDPARLSAMTATPTSTPTDELATTLTTALSSA